MSKTYVLYNPIAGNGACDNNVNKLDEILKDEDLIYLNYKELEEGTQEFFDRLEINDKVILCGGDGTINYFVNDIDTERIENTVYYYPLGSGNDFYNDVKDREKDVLIPLNSYIKNLPQVSVNGKTSKFLNAIGYGIDGYCCEEGDRVRLKKAGKPVNYTKIALKGLCYDFHRVHAKITVDGKEYEYKDVWMAPALHGRYYGGGMMCAPNQDRINHNSKVSVIVVNTKYRLPLLVAFLSIFKGEHLKYKNIVHELKGSEVKVVFDRPTPLQIDGETISGVTEYSVFRK